MVRVLVSLAADADIDAAKQWYESQRSGLGQRFVTSVEDALRRIQRFPEAYGSIFGEARHVIMRSFPYILVYTYENEEVVVHAVYHSGRDDDWKSRL